MANGDAALAAGMDVVLATDDIRMAYDEENKTRDYIANLTASDIATATSASVQLDLNFLGSRIDGVEDYAGAVNDNANSRLPYAGGVISGHIYLPASTAAVSGYTICYINSDGRVSRGASSERYKKDITRDCDLPDVFAAPISRYRMREDPDGVWRYGYIAEDLAEHEATRGFVVRDEEARPDSYDMIGLLLAQVAQLRREIDELKGAQ